MDIDILIPLWHEIPEVSRMIVKRSVLKLREYLEELAKVNHNIKNYLTHPVVIGIFTRNHPFELSMITFFDLFLEYHRYYSKCNYQLSKREWKRTYYYRFFPNRRNTYLTFYEMWFEAAAKIHVDENETRRCYEELRSFCRGKEQHFNRRSKALYFLLQEIPSDILREMQNVPEEFCKRIDGLPLRDWIK